MRQQGERPRGPESGPRPVRASKTMSCSCLPDSTTAFPSTEGVKGHRKRRPSRLVSRVCPTPKRALSSTGRGKGNHKRSRVHGQLSFVQLNVCLLPTGSEERPSQAHGQSMNISGSSNLNERLACGRYEEKTIASVTESMSSSFSSHSTIAISSAGNGKRPSQAHAKTLDSPRSIVFCGVSGPFFKKGI